MPRKMAQNRSTLRPLHDRRRDTQDELVEDVLLRLQVAHDWSAPALALVPQLYIVHRCPGTAEPRMEWATPVNITDVRVERARAVAIFERQIERARPVDIAVGRRRDWARSGSVDGQLGDAAVVGDAGRELSARPAQRGMGVVGSALCLGQSLLRDELPHAVG